MENQKIRVAITHGDTNGTGYELILRAFEDPTMLELCTPIVYGSPKVAAYHAKALGIETQFTIINSPEEAKDGRLNLLNCFDEEVKVDMGQPTQESAEAARKALEQAMADYEKGVYDALVMAPTANFDPTSFLQKRLNARQQPLVVRCSDDLRVALVTNHVAIKDVPEAITKQKIVEKAQLMHQSLRRDLTLSSPRIAVLALNPHADEDGQLGEEEQTIIAPAIAELAEQGIQAFGPYPADEFFGTGQYLRFDGVLAMYYDQGMTAFKTLVSEGSVDFTAGLPLVVTAPAVDSCFEQAGQTKVSALPLLHAIYMAIDATRNRRNYDEPLQNPLPKLYHEKRDDSEKVRFRSSEHEKEKKEPKKE